jgi:CRISPR-associated endoribonuclease Cas6
MRFCLDFIPEKDLIPLDYRSCFLSIFKTAYQSYNHQLYEKLYAKDNILQKPYTFSVFLGNSKFSYKTILLENKILKLNYSTYSYDYGISFYNAMLKIKYKPLEFGQNRIVLKTINMVNEKPINSDKIAVRTLSPIIIRRHIKEQNFDFYYDFGHKDSIDVLKKNIYSLSQNYFDYDIRFDLNDLKIIPIKFKKTEILYRHHKITGNVGRVAILGKPYLLDYLLKAGMGARRSQGFGMLELEEMRS